MNLVADEGVDGHITSKFLCTVIKVLPDDNFIITVYYTDTIKRGETLWEKP